MSTINDKVKHCLFVGLLSCKEMTVNFTSLQCTVINYKQTS